MGERKRRRPCDYARPRRSIYLPPDRVNLRREYPARRQPSCARVVTQPAKELTPNIIGGTFNNVKITFDPAKRRAALDGRGLNFVDASIIFAGPTITAQDTRRDYGEAHFQTVGFLADRMVMVVWTPRDGTRHVISMRKCNDREKAI
jgi:uncharacterized DUF497 family protein